MAQHALSGPDEILATVRRFWGFEGLRPLQAEAIRAGLDRRDSLVVMPTGGGKSLCYQVPPAVARRTDIVVSPLIALMKDQAARWFAAHSELRVVIVSGAGRAFSAGADLQDSRRCRGAALGK